MRFPAYAIVHVSGIGARETLGIRVDVLHLDVMWCVLPVFLVLTACRDTQQEFVFVIGYLSVFRQGLTASLAHNVLLSITEYNSQSQLILHVQEFCYSMFHPA
jgi:hypothetical protein